jgi:twitching motility two-component system response regulator PilG
LIKGYRTVSETRIVLSPQGLKENELHLLKTICVLSEGRGRSYSFLCSKEPLPHPTVWVVDESAEPLWRESHGKGGALAVVISASPNTDPGRYVVRRPMTPSRLLAALDAIAEQEMGLLSHMVIGGSGSAEPPAAGPAPGARDVSRATHTALVVDDSTTIQKQIEVSLHALGVAAICVDNAESAMTELDNNSFDLIFLDVILPGDADGYQICKRIRRHPTHKRTPVIMLTSKSSTFDRVRGSMAGCDTYLTKPVDADTFREVVAKYLPDAGDAVLRQQFT